MITFVLGAPDPEMELIERIARQLPRTRVLYAAVGGQRVRPFQAYKADSLIDDEGNEVDAPQSGTVILVETELPSVDFGDADVRVADHHRPGDPGYGRPPEEFLEASSIGQVVRHAETLGLTRPGDLDVDEDEILMAAAADHCLPYAYRGRCPGVLPERLMRWRVATRAAFQRKDPQELLRQVEETTRFLEELIDEGQVLDLGGVAVVDVRPGRHVVCAVHGMSCPGTHAGCYGDVPELPEAAVRLGVPVLAKPAPGPRDRAGKTVLLGAPPEAVEAFLAGEGPAAGLTGLYGDPARGFAGGYQE